MTHEQLFAGTGSHVCEPIQSTSVASLAWLGCDRHAPCGTLACYLALCYRDDTHTHTLPGGDLCSGTIATPSPYIEVQRCLRPVHVTSSNAAMQTTSMLYLQAARHYMLQLQSDMLQLTGEGMIMKRSALPRLPLHGGGSVG